MDPSEKLFREHCQFLVSFRLELFDALQTLLNPKSRIHPGWKKFTLGRLPGRFHELCERVGNASEIWPVVPAVLEKSQAVFTFNQVVSEIESQSTDEFRRKI